ncbi:MAG: cytochrome c [Nitrospiraceae bacterium]|nr:cytochrome c [Nitrospiraceae bacterium]
MMGGLMLAEDLKDTQTTLPTDCTAEGLEALMQSMGERLPLDFAADTDTATANLYRRGLVYQQIALACGYTPTQAEGDMSIDLTLKIADLNSIIQALSVGTDSAAALAAIQNLDSDPSRGQQLYNGLEPVLDGTRLTCAGCHNGETAPVVEGTWTRVDEIRLQEPILEGYTVEQYLVESIIHPNAYLVPGHLPDLMPDYFGTRLDAQMLADLVAYLDSHDQLLPTPTPMP